MIKLKYLFLTCCLTVSVSSALADCGICYDDSKACLPANLDNCEGTCGGNGSVSDRCLKDGKITKDVWEKYRHYACGPCSSYPDECGMVESCIKYCNSSNYAAKACYDGGMISLDLCNKLYSPCEQSPQEKACLTKCNAFPSPICDNFEFCYGGNCPINLAAAAQDAPYCMHSGKLTMDQCRKYSGQCGGSATARTAERKIHFNTPVKPGK